MVFYNVRKWEVLAGLDALGPSRWWTARDVTIWLRDCLHHDFEDFDFEGELVAVGLRLQCLAHERGPGDSFGYSKPYLRSRLVVDPRTGRRARAYKLGAKGRRILGKMDAGELRGKDPDAAPLPLKASKELSARLRGHTTKKRRRRALRDARPRHGDGARSASSTDAAGF